MGEKSHTFQQPDQARRRQPETSYLWRRLLLLTLPWWAVSVLLFLLSSHAGPLGMNTLAQREADLKPHSSLEGLRMARSLLSGPRGGDLLWEARKSGAEVEFFLAGAVRTEKLKRPDQTYLWLGLEALAHDHPQRAREWMAQASAGHGFALPSAAEIRNRQWLTRQELVRPLIDSLADTQ